MVEVYYVHPNLAITDSSDYCSLNLDEYKEKRDRAIKNYENLVTEIKSLRDEAQTIPEDEKIVTALIEDFSKTSLNTEDGSKQLESENLATVDTDREVKSEKDEIQCSDMESKILELYKTELELCIEELNYLKCYCSMMGTIKEVFSRSDLSWQEEEEGLKQISEQQETVKALEEELKQSKNEKNRLQSILQQNYGIKGLLGEPHKKKWQVNLNSITEEGSIG